MLYPCSSPSCLICSIFQTERTALGLYTAWRAFFLKIYVAFFLGGRKSDNMISSTMSWCLLCACRRACLRTLSQDLQKPEQRFRGVKECWVATHHGRGLIANFAQLNRLSLVDIGCVLTHDRMSDAVPCSSLLLARFSEDPERRLLVRAI